MSLPPEHPDSSRDPSPVSASVHSRRGVSPRLLDRVRDAIRARHFSPRTEEAYVRWMRRSILFHGKRHPQEMGAPEIVVFLSHLASQGKVSASTQNQALSALLFVYRGVLRASCARSNRYVSRSS